MNSTSVLEVLWHEIKAKFTNTYATIPNNNFFYFLREIEFKIKHKHLNYEDKIKSFFD